MLPMYCSNCFYQVPKEFTNSQPYQIMPNYNMGGQIQMQTPKPTQQPMQQPAQQQPTDDDFSSNFVQAPGSPTNLGIAYTQGYLKTQIGKRMRITFLIGTSQIQDRQGTLTEVGISYIIIKDIDTNTFTLCDIYAIKFVTIYP